MERIRPEIAKTGGVNIWRRRFVALLAIATCLIWFAIDATNGIGPAATRQYLGLGVIALCGWISYEAYKTKRAVESPGFSRLAYRVFLLFLGFTILRSVAAIVDAYFAFSVAWFSTAVNYGFYVYVGLTIRRNRQVLERSEMDPATGKRRISTKADAFFDEVTAIGQRAERAAKQ